MAAVTFAEPTTTRTPTPTQVRPIDYHAQPKNLPPTQRNVYTGDLVSRPDILPKNTASQAPSVRNTSASVLAGTNVVSGNSFAQEQAAEAAAYYGGWALSGFWDGAIEGKNYPNEQLRLKRDPVEDSAYTIGQKAGDGLRSITQDGVNGLKDLWDNRPQFEIPAIKIPKFERPGLPDIFKPKPKPEIEKKPLEKPIPGQPKPTVPEPEQKPEPETKEKDIPIPDKDKPKYPRPEPFPGSQRFRIPVLCDCAASLSFGLTVIGGNDNQLITEPGMGYMSYLASGLPAPNGVVELNPRTGSDKRFGESSSVQAMGGYIPGQDGLFVYYTSIRVEASQQGDGYVDLIMPKFKGTAVNWGYISTACLGCDPRENIENPPPDPPKDCDCMSQCCPEIDYRKIQKIIEQELKKLDLTTAVPDSWLIRPEHHRPQMIIQFGEILAKNKIDSAKYPITIPHPKSNKPNKSAIPPYKKGNWEMIFVLKDNSKITIHAFNEIEATKVMNAAKQLVIPEYLTGGYLSKSSKVITSEPLAEINVSPKMAKYFPDGRKSRKPEWIIKF